MTSSFPACNYIFKVNYRNTRTRCLICSKLTIKTPERHWLLGFLTVSGTTPFWVHSRICFRKGRRCCWKKVTKNKIWSMGFNLTKKWFNSTDISNQSTVYLFGTSNYFALIILQHETVKLNVTKSYILVDVMGVLALM